jgi:glutathione S-transferase
MSYKYTLYGMSHSLYTGKARSYLIKQNADFEEVTAGATKYHKEIMPKIGRWIIPVLVGPDETIIQDGTSIIDWYEANDQPRQSAYPKTPRHLITSLIFEIFGGEGLLRPAMHYRWNFDADNQKFIEDQFGLFAMPTAPKNERHEVMSKAAGRMRRAAVGFGVVPDTMGEVEAAYLEFLDEFNQHLETHPYLLGGQPSLGDYGLIAPLFAHLGRDPYPARLMKIRAPAVFRWTERMNATGPDMPEFPDYPQTVLDADAVPDTLMTLLRRVAADYLPEVRAYVEFQNHWLTENQVAEGDEVGGAPLVRGIGSCEFSWRGKTINTVVMPYRIFMLQRIQDAYDAMTELERKAVDALLEQTGLMDMIRLRSARRVERHNNREVWGALTTA